MPQHPLASLLQALVANGNPKKLNAAANCGLEHRRRTGKEACGRWGCSGLAVILELGSTIAHLSLLGREGSLSIQQGSEGYCSIQKARHVSRRPRCLHRAYTRSEVRAGSSRPQRPSGMH
jgi:hypothetical protein